MGNFCNNLSPLLVDIVLFGLSFGLPLKVFKTHLLERGFHTLINNVSFSSPTNVGSHNFSLDHTIVCWSVTRDFLVIRW